MRFSMLGACVVLILALVASTEGQGTKGKKLPALAHDATLVKIEEKKGTPTKVYFECSEEDGKKLGYKKGNHAITKATKFIFVGPDGEKNFTQKTVLADEEAKKHLEAGSKIRLQLSGIECEELHFGPDLKPQGIKRMR
jgi:hypothetical protein